MSAPTIPPLKKSGLQKTYIYESDENNNDSGQRTAARHYRMPGRLAAWNNRFPAAKRNKSVFFTLRLCIFKPHH
jgi:hypothetical protein